MYLKKYSNVINKTNKSIWENEKEQTFNQHIQLCLFVALA